VVTWVMRGQFISIDLFKNLQVMVIFRGYNGFDIRVVIFGFLQCSVDLIKGWGELFNFAIAPIGIINDVLEHSGRNSTDLVPILWGKSFDWDRGYHGIVG
jgi:hypothetical protein